MMQNPFADLIPPPQGAGPVVIGTPRPRLPPPQTPTQEALDEANLRLRQSELDEAESEAHRRQMEQGTPEDLQAELLNVVRNAIDARRLSREGTLTTGGGSAIGQRVGQVVGGTSAADLDAALATIRSNVAFTRLQRMRQESPTGGAVGNVSDADLRLLGSTIAALDTSQSDERFQQSMRAVIDAYSRVYDRLGGDQMALADVLQADPAWPRLNVSSPPPIANGGTPIEEAPDIVVGQGIDPATGQPVGPAPRPGSDPASLLTREAIERGNPLTGGLMQAGTALFGREGGDAFRRGFYDVPTLGFSDEIGAGLQAGFGQGSFDENLARERAINEYDEQNNFGARLSGQLTGGLALPISRGAGLGRQMLEAGAYGGSYGFGSGQGGSRVPNALIGAGIGAALPPIVAGGRNALTNLRGARPMAAAGEAAPEEIANALLAEKIPAARPIADPSARGRMAYLETTRGGHETVRSGLEQTRGAIEDRAAQLRGPGSVQTPGGMGQSIQEAGQRRLDTLRARARAFYDRGAQTAGDMPVQPTSMLAKLDRYIARLSRNPNANRGTLDYLTEIRGDLADDAGNSLPKTLADIRDLRTGLRDEINRRNLLRTRAEAVMEDVLAGASEDIARDIGDGAPEALRYYQRGDALWSQLHRDEREVIRRLVGPADNPLPGEKVLARVVNMMSNRGDIVRFRRVMSMLTPEERQDFVATIVEPIGRRAPDEPFSPALFLANTRGMQPDALRTVFGRDGAKSVTNLRLAAQGFTAATNSLNRSRSGFVANFKDVVSSLTNLRSAAGGGLGFAAGGLPGAVAGAVATEGIQRGTNFLSARTLMNPDVSRWIRRVARADTPGAVRSAVNDLNRIASRNPAIAQEVTGLRDLLMRAANDNLPSAGRVAASPSEGPDNTNEDR